MSIFPFRRKAVPLSLIPSAVAPGTSIRWDAGLVARLQADHKLFIKQYRQLVAAQNAGNYGALPPMLDKFQSALLDHILTEKTRLYVYLRHQFDGDPSTAWVTGTPEGVGPMQVESAVRSRTMFFFKFSGIDCEK